MPRRHDVQDPTGRIEYIPGYGTVQAWKAGTPTNGQLGFAPACIWHNVTGSLGSEFYINIGSFTSSLWLNIDGMGLAGLSRAEAANALTTAGAGTLTAAQIVGGIVNRSGPTANFTDTTDTAANIIAALPSGTGVGATWELKIINTTAWQQTIANGLGVTLAGVGTVIPANSVSWWLCTYTGPGAVTMYLLESSYSNVGGFDPSSVLTQFGSGTGTFLEEGNIYRQVSSAGISPGSINNDNVLMTFALPANSLDGVGNRGLCITAAGSVANNTNSKRLKLWWGTTTQTVGSAVVGGTLIADSGAYTTTGAAGWQVGANVFKYGAANSNTQLALHTSAQIGSTVGALIVPATLTATENAVINITLTGNAVTATTDIFANWLEINAMN